MTADFSCEQFWNLFVLDIYCLYSVRYCSTIVSKFVHSSLFIEKKKFIKFTLCSAFKTAQLSKGCLFYVENNHQDGYFYHTYSLLILYLFRSNFGICIWQFEGQILDFLCLHLLNKIKIYNHCFLDTNFMTTWGFIWKVLAITAVSCVPLYIMKLIRKKVAPSSYQKLT